MKEVKSKTAFEGLKKALPPQIEMDIEDVSLLEEANRELLNEDLKASLEIRKYLKTSQTYSNSLGNIYNYLLDHKACLNCPGELSLCKKNNAGYQLQLTYDKVRDLVYTHPGECPFLKDKNDILSRFEPCYEDRERIFRTYVDFTSALRSGKKMNDSLKALLDANKIIEKFSSDMKFKGACFNAINSSSLASDLMKTIAFFYAKKGYNVSYIDTYSFFLGYLNKDYEFVESTQRAFNQICNIPVLCLENFNLFPKVDIKLATDTLYTLLKRRNEAHKVTYCTCFSQAKANKVVKDKLSDSNVYQNALSLVDEIFDDVVIKDIYLR